MPASLLGRSVAEAFSFFCRKSPAAKSRDSFRVSSCIGLLQHRMKGRAGTRLRTAPPVEIDEDDLVAQSAEVSLQCPFSPRPPALSVADDDQRMRAQNLP